MSRILLATDEPVLGEGLRRLLAGRSRFQLVSRVANLESVPQAAATGRANIALLDWNLGISLSSITSLGDQLRGCRLVLWVRSIAAEFAFQAIDHGVRGILQKTAPAEVVLQCFGVVSDGGFWVEDSLQNRRVSCLAIQLTRRESDLVTRVAQGMKNKEIASALDLTEATVKVYLCKLYDKLGVKDRYELALYGLRNLAEAQQLPAGARSGTEAPTAKPPGHSPWLRSIVIDRPNWNSSTH